MELHPRAPLSFHVPAQLEGLPFHRDGSAAIKFNSFWTIELEPGWSLFATHPVNRDELPFRLISGLVDADRFHDGGINFPAIWTEPDFSGVLPRGTPVAQCIPIKREEWTVRTAALTAEENQRAHDLTNAIYRETGVYRRQFRA